MTAGQTTPFSAHSRENTRCTIRCPALRLRQRKGDLSQLVRLRCNLLELQVGRKLQEVVRSHSDVDPLFYAWVKFAEVATATTASSIAAIIHDTMMDLIAQLCECEAQ